MAWIEALNGVSVRVDAGLERDQEELVENAHKIGAVAMNSPARRRRVWARAMRRAVVQRGEIATDDEVKTAFAKRRRT